MGRGAEEEAALPGFMVWEGALFGRAPGRAARPCTKGKEGSVNTL